MVWYVSTWYDVSIIGYCRVWYGMLVWYGVLEWYCWAQKWPLFDHPYPPLFASSYPIVQAKQTFFPHLAPQVTKVWLIIVLIY